MVYKPNITLKTDLLESGYADVRTLIGEILELTNKPYLTKGDVRKLTALSQVIKKARSELLEYKAFIDTRLKNRDQTPTKPPVKEIDLAKLMSLATGKPTLLMDE